MKTGNQVSTTIVSDLRSAKKKQKTANETKIGYGQSFDRWAEGAPSEQMKRVSLTLEWLVILGIVMVLGALLSQQIAKNLTQTQVAVLEIRSTERKLQSLQMLVDTIPGGVCIVDELGSIVYANQGLEGLSFYKRRQLIGYSFTKLMPESYRADHLERINDPSFATSIEGDTRCIPQGKLLRSDGRVLTLRINIHRHRYDGDSEWLVFFDPTEIELE